MISKQSGYLTDVGSAINLLIAMVGLFWLGAGVGIGYWIWG